MNRREPPRGHPRERKSTVNIVNTVERTRRGRKNVGIVNIVTRTHRGKTGKKGRRMISLTETSIALRENLIDLGKTTNYRSWIS